MNVDHLDGIESSAVVLRTYRDEIARIELRDDGITLPPWADHPHSSDSVRS
jgi:hypothetical protein